MLAHTGSHACLHTQTLVITLTQEHTFRLVAPWHAHISHHTYLHIYKYTHRNTYAFTTTHTHTHRDVLTLACMRPHNLPAWMSPYTHACMHAQNACMQGTLLRAHNMNARTDTAGTGLPSTLPRTSEEAEEEKVSTSFSF